ncbi:MAG: dioxygenase [Candidatus Cloacimonetes bacterium]|nr:dioxygenase [Candidatus Cloacimonadota bacterium]
MLPTFFISHGGGPWPWMKQQRESIYANLARSLSELLPSLPTRPEAILMISAHWEEEIFTVQGHSNPGMIYDYFGFPEHTYSVKYPAPGHSALANKVCELLNNASLSARVDVTRGYDHGMYSPMALIDPKAQIPVVQLSLKQGLDPLAHIKVGRVLEPLRSQGILIVGSGLSYHNLRAFGILGKEASARFDSWLLHSVVEQTGKDRTERLLHWEDAPSAREAHPREEHLIPLMVAVGASESEKGHLIYHEEDFVGLTVSSFRFGS